MLKKYLVNVSVADLRREPLFGSESLQETQLLYNERLLGFSENNGWIYVSALEQKKLLPDGEWSGYPGWVKAEHLVEVKRFSSPSACVCVPWVTLFRKKGEEAIMDVCLGTKLKSSGSGEWRKVKLADGKWGFVHQLAIRPICEAGLSDAARDDLLTMGKTLAGAPYTWGGRSMYAPKWGVSSVDCSGLVNLLYRLQGIDLARDAHDQFLQCSRCEPIDLKLGDLVFLADRKKTHRIHHVMLFAGNDRLLEASSEKKQVQLVSFKEKLGRSLSQLHCGDLAGSDTVYFGKVLTETVFSI